MAERALGVSDETLGVPEPTTAEVAVLFDYHRRQLTASSRVEDIGRKPTVFANPPTFFFSPTCDLRHYSPLLRRVLADGHDNVRPKLSLSIKSVSLKKRKEGMV